MPQTAQSINAQLRTEPLAIPDRWAADSIKPNHEIGRAEHLFRRIDPEKAQEWREMFGSKEAAALKEEEAVMKAKKSAAKKTRAVKTAKAASKGSEAANKGLGASAITPPTASVGVDDESTSVSTHLGDIDGT